MLPIKSHDSTVFVSKELSNTLIKLAIIYLLPLPFWLNVHRSVRDASWTWSIQLFPIIIFCILIEVNWKTRHTMSINPRDQLGPLHWWISPAKCKPAQSKIVWKLSVWRDSADSACATSIFLRSVQDNLHCCLTLKLGL